MDMFEKKLLINLKCWHNNQKKPPLVLTLRVTRGCDLNCLFCAPYKDSVLKDELEFSQYQTILKEAHLLGIKYCALVGGGEVLYKKKLTLNIIDLAKEYGMTCWMVTNGFNFDKKTIIHLIDIGFDTILFSIDGATPETHDYLRGVKGTFERVVYNIQRFNYLKKKLHKKRPFLKAQTLILNENYYELEAILTLVKKLDMKEYLINYFVPQFPSEKKFLLSKKEEVQFNKKIQELLKIQFIRSFTNFMEYLRIQELVRNKYYANIRKDLFSSYCFQPWYHLNISEKGDVNACPEWNRGHRIKIFNRTINDIWNSKYMNDFRNDILNKKMLGFCQKQCNFSVALENTKISEMIHDQF